MKLNNIGGIQIGYKSNKLNNEWFLDLSNDLKSFKELKYIN